jgi:hypothetical protein
MTVLDLKGLKEIFRHDAATGMAAHYVHRNK